MVTLLHPSFNLWVYLNYYLEVFMTKKDFDSYRFSIKTQVKVEGEWYKVVGVDFAEYIVEVRINGHLAYFSPREIKSIKESL